MRSQRREQAIDVTDRVKAVVRKSGVRAGTCTVHVRHTTAGVVVNENADPDVLRDLLVTLGRLVPDEGDYGARSRAAGASSRERGDDAPESRRLYRHAEGNSPAHIRAVLTGAATSVPVEDGELALGRWQGIFVIDFDGPREREVEISVIGE